MRISDWSSDVCSSDLREGRRRRALRPEQRGRAAALGVGRQQAPRPADRDEAGEAADVAAPDPLDRAEGTEGGKARQGAGNGDTDGHGLQEAPAGAGIAIVPSGRSEEHTSELQSLMRISYAVFCLKQKK